MDLGLIQINILCYATIWKADSTHSAAYPPDMGQSDFEDFIKVVIIFTISELQWQLHVEPWWAFTITITFKRSQLNYNYSSAEDVVVCIYLSHEANKSLCYCRGTARRATSVEILWPFFD